jgi:hypothetical protein
VTKKRDGMELFGPGLGMDGLLLFSRRASELELWWSE